MKLKAMLEPFYWKAMTYAARYGMIACALPLEIGDKAALDKLPESQRGLYKEDGGKWRLEVEGYEDPSGYKATLEKERKERRDSEKKLKEQLQRFDGIEPDKVRDLLKQFEDSEESELLKKGKEGIDLIINKRTEKMRKDFEKQLQLANNDSKKSKDVSERFKGLVLDNYMRAAASKSNVHATAMDDVLLRGKTVFTLGEDGKPVAMDESGEVRMGKDGKTPYHLEEWIEEMREGAPHWFPADGRGSGAQGDKGGKGGGKTIKRSLFDNMSPADKHKALNVDKLVVVDG